MTDPNARASSPTAFATPSHHRPSRDERGLDRRRRLEHVGGDQPHRRAHGRGHGELRLALLRGQRAPVGLRRREPGNSASLYAAGPNAIAAPYYAWNHSAKVVPNETCPTGSSSAAGAAFYTGSSYPGYTDALLRRLLARLHLGDTDWNERPAEPGHDRDLRGRRGQPGRHPDRAWRRPLLRRLRRRHDPAGIRRRADRRPSRSSARTRPPASRRSRCRSAAPARRTPTAARSRTPGISTRTAPSTTRRRRRRRSPTRSRGRTTCSCASPTRAAPPTPRR